VAVRDGYVLSSRFTVFQGTRCHRVAIAGGSRIVIEAVATPWSVRKRYRLQGLGTGPRLEVRDALCNLTPRMLAPPVLGERVEEYSPFPFLP